VQEKCGLGWRCRPAQRKEGKGPRSGLASVAGLQLSSQNGPRLACWTDAREGEDRVSMSIRCSTKTLGRCQAHGDVAPGACASTTTWKLVQGRERMLVHGGSLAISAAVVVKIGCPVWSSSQSHGWSVIGK
jgi:hypothetical protein